MRRIVRFFVLLGWFLFTDVVHSLMGASYVVAVASGVLTAGVLFVRQVQEKVRLDPWSAGGVVALASVLGVLFLSDNVVRPRSVAAVVVSIVVFSLAYLLLQGRLEREE